MNDKPGNNKELLDELMDLRFRAQSIIDDQPLGSTDLTNFSKTDLQKLVHDLQVHQIELELQNQELLQTQLELSQSRDSYAEFYDFAPVGYLEVSNAGLIFRANLTMVKFLQVERTLLIGRRLSSFIIPEDQDRYYLNVKQLTDNLIPRTFDIRLARTDGSTFHARIECTPTLDQDGKLARFLLVISDISDLKQIQEDLEKSWSHLRLALEASGAMIWEFDLEASMGCRSMGSWRILEIDPDSLKPSARLWAVSIHPDDITNVQETIAETVLESGDIDAQWRVIDQQGNVRWLMFRGQPGFDANGQANSYLGIAVDVTASKKTEEALRESETRYRTLFYSLKDLLDMHSETVHSSEHKVGLRSLFAVSKDLEKGYIENALRKTKGKIQPAAKLLGISRFTLARQMAKMGIHGKDFKR